MIDNMQVYKCVLKKNLIKFAIPWVVGKSKHS